MSDIEFQVLDDLKKLRDEQLNDIVTEGVNLHIHTSRASMAKRVLDERVRVDHLKLIDSTKAINENTVRSNLELQRISEDLEYIAVVLAFFKKHWFPNKSLLFKVLTFVFGTVVLGILLNVVSDAIVTFVFHW